MKECFILCTLWTVIYGEEITFLPFILKNLPILSKNTSLARGTTGSEDFKRLLEIYHFVQYRLWEFSCWSKPIWNPFHHIITNNDQHSCYRLSHDWSSKQYSCDKKISSCIVALQRKCKEINGNKEDLRLLQSVGEKCELKAKSEG